LLKQHQQDIAALQSYEQTRDQEALVHAGQAEQVLVNTPRLAPEKLQDYTVTQLEDIMASMEKRQADLNGKREGLVRTVAVGELDPRDRLGHAVKDQIAKVEAAIKELELEHRTVLDVHAERMKRAVAISQQFAARMHTSGGAVPPAMNGLGQYEKRDVAAAMHAEVEQIHDDAIYETNKVQQLPEGMAKVTEEQKLAEMKAKEREYGSYDDTIRNAAQIYGFETHDVPPAAVPPATQPVPPVQPQYAPPQYAGYPAIAGTSYVNRFAHPGAQQQYAAPGGPQMQYAPAQP